MFRIVRATVVTVRGAITISVRISNAATAYSRGDLIGIIGATVVRVAGTITISILECSRATAIRRYAGVHIIDCTSIVVVAGVPEELYRRYTLAISITYPDLSNRALNDAGLILTIKR
ncbi:MAG: hypothetical protein IPG74_01205 [Flavobacteriales bacterium]|nr:hypothetical protein [Flavobacteriales bacterium]